MDLEEAVLKAFPKATIIKPTFMFGEEDKFFNMLKCMMRFTPIFPIIGDASKKIQPVHVNDVALLMKNLLADSSYCGKRITVVGPKAYNWKQIYKILSNSKCKCFFNMPYAFSYVLALLSEILPKALLTRDKLKMLQHGYTSKETSELFAKYNIVPKYFA